MAMEGLTREFRIGRALDTALVILLQNFWKFLLLALGAEIPPLSMSLLNVMAYYYDYRDFNGDIPTWPSLTLSLATLFLDSTAGFILIAALTHGTSSSLAGKPVSARACSVTALRDLPALAAISVIATIGLYGGLFAFVVPGLFFIAAWSVVVPVRAVEGVPVRDAFVRSILLTLGHRWPLLGFFFGATVVYYLVSYMVGWLGVSLDIFRLSISTVVVGGVVVRSLLHLGFVLLFGVASASIYYELRGEKDGVLPEQLAAVFD